MSPTLSFSPPYSEHDMLEEITRLGRDIADSLDTETLRENANLNGDSFSGKMSKFGSEYAKWYARLHLLPKEVEAAIRGNTVYVHDLDHYAVGMTNCIFIPFDKLLAQGFSTGNGDLRTPQTIMTAMALTAIIFQCQQNAQYGGVSANKLDHDLAPYVGRSFLKHFRKGLAYFESFAGERSELSESLSDTKLYDTNCSNHNLTNTAPFNEAKNAVPADEDIRIDNIELRDRYPHAYRYAYQETRQETFQAAESLIHNLNTMSSRGGGQIPFTSINYGTCTSSEGRLVMESLMEATMRGLGQGQTPIFPIQIIKCKKGVNQQPGEPNYDLFLKAIECSTKRLYPNFANLDAPINLEHYIPGDPDTEFATMGCRTRVIADRFGRNHLSGKGNLSFNTINLVKLGIENGIVLGARNQADEAGFYAMLDEALNIALAGLLHRYRIQASQPAKASDFMMREGVWEGGEALGPDDRVEVLLKHGSLSIGFIGIAEAMKAMYGKHHAEDDEVYTKALEIVRHMRAFCDAMSDKHNLNITLFATPAEGLSGKFTKNDAAQYGSIPGVTDRPYYTNSFHVPVYYPTTAARKISLEAPFHELCSAGAISYIELDGSVRSNPEAFRKIVTYTLEQNVSYFSINHPIDRCTSCGYEGIIGASCPSCGCLETEVHISRLRRVTGYLTGDYQTRFNGAKQAEVRDRVKHTGSSQPPQ
ncbi:anaerobic ribonucleoside triphosphate reductase [Saccharibacillus kuerlensis]|uniref:Anaerobic ribonucleoside triphosphate reductase n=1 Tax=Saccharibacillus kuerlensis TaxID=459527 RepID=A0ABQ2L1T1_9BACL|nr:anaerobic ribonucleoside triphosphate reductase [Saccharibacillus kuerlensis]GGN99805.1 anaerobic ribonucleoside triphosphate reductase [Saccharibacillus kuerlensis]